MVIGILLFLGLLFGSFVNAVVWRIHEQESAIGKKKVDKHYLERLSISKGRSMCSHCHHELAPKDLVPVFSWLYLRGKCRYCHKPIPDSPVIEIGMAALFAASYIWWPITFDTIGIAQFVFWLAIAVGLMALAAYDLRWYLLPNRIMLPLVPLASVFAALSIWAATNRPMALLYVLLAVAIGGGIFYVLFQVSDGKWIGGGDVKLGWLLGLIVLTPARSILFIFIAAVAGTLVSLPMLVTGKMKRSAVIPFGPFLILGAVIVVLFGTDILQWYQRLIFAN